MVARYEDPNSNPTGQWVHHCAGLVETGAASYIDTVILRDRDTDQTPDGTLGERVYYLQNWRADIVALITDTGNQVEQVRYEPYGTPFGLPAGDTDSDGDYDLTDENAITGSYDVRKDVNMDGSVSAADVTAAAAITGGYQTLGRGVMSSTAIENRKGYAGYEHLAELDGAKWDVRNRVLISELGTWNRRDPLGYVDGMNLYAYVMSMPIVMSDALGQLTVSTSTGGGPTVVGSVTVGCEKYPIIIAGEGGCGGNDGGGEDRRGDCPYPKSWEGWDSWIDRLNMCSDWAECWADSQGWMTNPVCRNRAISRAIACCRGPSDPDTGHFYRVPGYEYECKLEAFSAYRSCMNTQVPPIDTIPTFPTIWWDELMKDCTANCSACVIALIGLGVGCGSGVTTAGCIAAALGAGLALPMPCVVCMKCL